ncbi:hypothetical protein HanIR_Chr16g0843901 [Helianthus annuus]|nr:hypothetical protein HanIR_Chr16g0843901 [Helianthus annuus]
MAEVLAGETMITLGTRDNDKSLLYGSAKLKGRKVQFDSQGLSPFRRTFTVQFPTTFRSPFCKRGGLLNLKDLFVTPFIDELEHRISLEMLYQMHTFLCNVTICTLYIPFTNLKEKN